MRLKAERASDFSIKQLAEILNAAYEGYILPMAFEPFSLARRFQAEHTDLPSSAVFVNERGEPIAVALISRRGSTSRVSALGVVPHFRDAGIGGRAIAWCLAEARARCDQQMVLEAIEGNGAAIATYRRAGFEEARRLVGYVHEPVDTGPRVFSSSTLDALAVLATACCENPSWQSSPLSFASVSDPVHAYRNENGTAVAVVDASAPTVRLLAFAVSPAARRRGEGSRFMQGLLAAFPDRRWKIPEYLPVGRCSNFLAAAGWQLSQIRQIEMVHRLE